MLYVCVCDLVMRHDHVTGCEMVQDRMELRDSWVEWAVIDSNDFVTGKCKREGGAGRSSDRAEGAVCSDAMAISSSELWLCVCSGYRELDDLDDRSTHQAMAVGTTRQTDRPPLDR